MLLKKIKKGNGCWLNLFYLLEDLCGGVIYLIINTFEY